MAISEMVRLLMGAGLTQGEIAAAVDTTQPTISRALAGNDVRYGVGKAIERLYEQRLLSLTPPDAA